MTKPYTMSGDRFIGTFTTERRPIRVGYLAKNTRWHGIPIKWTGEFKDGKYFVHADAGETPWRHKGTCRIVPGYHLVDACDAIIDAWLDDF